MLEPDAYVHLCTHTDIHIGGCYGNEFKIHIHTFQLWGGNYTGKMGGGVYTLKDSMTLGRMQETTWSVEIVLHRPSFTLIRKDACGNSVITFRYFCAIVLGIVHCGYMWRALAPYSPPSSQSASRAQHWPFSPITVLLTQGDCFLQCSCITAPCIIWSNHIEIEGATVFNGFVWQRIWSISQDEW